MVDFVLANGVRVANITLLTLLVVRMCRLRLVRHYPYFFTYLSLVAPLNLAGWTVFNQRFPDYQRFYWIAVFVALLLGFLVVYEVYRHTFRPFHAIRLLVSWGILTLVLLILGTYCGLALAGTEQYDWEQMVVQLERWLRLTQAGLLAFLLASAHHYRLPQGRNVSGLATGFGLYVSFQLVNFSLHGLTLVDSTTARNLVADTFLLTLVVWLKAFRVHAPIPLPEPRLHSEKSYSRLNAVVTSALLGLRGSLRKTVGV